MAGWRHATLCAALIAVLGAPAATADVGRSATVTPYRAGYVATTLDPDVGTIYTRVSGTWKVPAVTCGRGDAGAVSRVWVGIGGYTTDLVIRAGTASNCDRSGRPSYAAWFDFGSTPDPQPAVRQTVAPGDTITATVNIVTQHLVRFELENHTRHWSFHRDAPHRVVDVSSAEWLVSAPSDCSSSGCSQPPLANFHLVRMSKLTAIGNGYTGNLFDGYWTVTPLRLVPPHSAGKAGAKPGPVANDGNSFGISWIPVATAV